MWCTPFHHHPINCPLYFIYHFWYFGVSSFDHILNSDRNFLPSWARSCPFKSLSSLPDSPLLFSVLLLLNSQLFLSLSFWNSYQKTRSRRFSFLNRIAKHSSSILPSYLILFCFLLSLLATKLVLLVLINIINFLVFFSSCFLFCLLGKKVNRLSK